ncbi:MAG: hypothetical protein ACJ74U_19360 [Jatrophihabitantaceae bacterium]
MSASTRTQLTGAEWGSPDTGWYSLSEHARQRIVECGIEHWRELHQGVTGYNKQWRPLRPVILTGQQLAELHRISDRIGELVLRCCRRRAGTAGELRRALGVPEGRIHLLDGAEPLTDDLLVSARPDILICGGVPKFVEFNIDGALGGAFDTDTMTANADSVYRAAGIADEAGLYPPPSAVDGRNRALADWLGPAADRRVAMIMDWNVHPAGPTDPADFLRFLEPVAERASHFGVELIPYWLHWLQADGQQRLLVAGEPVSQMFRLFVPDTPPPSSGLAALESVVQAGNLRCFTPSASWLVSNKLTLAWLWADLAEFAEDDRALIRAHIPRTRQLSAELADDAIAEQPGLVLKPCDGSAGRGVLMGRDEPPEVWRAGVEAAVRSGDFLVQELVVSDLLTMQFVEMATGRVVEQGVPACFGPYLFGHRQCGSLVRMGFPGSGAVMNVTHGVLMDGFSLVDA